MAAIPFSVQAEPLDYELFVHGVDDIRRKYDLPGLAVLVMNTGKIDRFAATGFRARDTTKAVTTDDMWHLGSCAKAMTATLMARLVEKGIMTWDRTVASVFTDFSNLMDPVSANITLDQLLSMTSGLAENPSNSLDLDQTISMLRTLDTPDSQPRQRRLKVVQDMLSQSPKSRPGSKASYSNTGYIIAGAMAETLCNKPYEILIADEVFAPLGMKHFGFGAPGTGTALDQPEGHNKEHGNRPYSPNDPEADLPSVFRPAGGIHMSLQDWSLFVSDVLDGIKGTGRLLKADSYHHLLTSSHLKPLGFYAEGWGVMEKDGRPVALAHTGSNARWFSSVNAYPQKDVFFLMATNDGRESNVEKAFGELRSRLKNDYQIG